MTEEYTKHCKKCPLKGNGPPVQTHGNLAEAVVLFLGQGPGVNEIQQGLPFVGKAGQLLKGIIDKYKIDRENTAFANTVRCRARDSITGKDREPTDKEISCCIKYLREELKESEFNGLIVLLGATALKAMLRKKGVTKARGYGFFEKGQKYLVTWHPAAPLHRQDGSSGSKKELDGDIRKVKIWMDDKFKLKYTMVDDLTKLCNFLLWVDEEIRQNGTLELSFDTETMGFNMFDPAIKILGLSFANDDEAWFIPLEHPESSFKGGTKKIMDYLSPLFTNKNIRLVIQHAKFDLKFILKKYGIIARNLYFDTKVAHFLIVGKFITHKLTGMAWKYTDLGGYDIDASNLIETPLEEVAYYCCMDSYVTFKLRKVFEPMMNKMNEKMMTLLTDIISPSIMAVTEIEVDGLKIDQKNLEEFYSDYSKRLTELESRMHGYSEIVKIEKETKELVNFNSPTQLREVFTAMKLSPTKRTKKKGEVSTDVDALQELQGQHPFIDDFMKYRKDVKVFGTYLAPYKERQVKGTIHGDYSFITTATGRLACEKPNLQNIPHSIRSLFRAKNDYFIEVDYGQLELRILAGYSFDKTLVAAYLAGEDIHEQTRQALFGDGSKDEKTAHTQRVVAKTLNFGVVYGITPIGVSKSLTKELERKVDQREAAGYINLFLNKYPAVRKYIKLVKEVVRRDGYLDTYFGRRREFDIYPGIYANQLEKIYRDAVNFPIQSTASDLVLVATGKIWHKMRDMNMKSKMVAHVHDSILFDLVDNELDIFLKMVKPTMEDISYEWLNVPLVIDLKMGYNWGEGLEEINL